MDANDDGDRSRHGCGGGGAADSSQGRKTRREGSDQRPVSSGLFGRRERQRVVIPPLAGARGYPANQRLNLLGD